jgi:hypothetical protein
MALLGQFKANVGLTIVNGDEVSVWADQSGNGNDMHQTVPSKRPKYVAVGASGRPSVRFDGAQTMYALSSSIMDVPSPGAAATCVAVIVPRDITTMPASGIIHGKYDSGFPRGWQLSVRTDDAANIYWRSNSTRQHSVSGTIGSGLEDVECIVQGRMNGGFTVDLHVNGALDNARTYMPSNPDTIGNSAIYHVGSLNDVSNYFYGDIIEWQFWDNAVNLDTNYNNLLAEYPPNTAPTGSYNSIVQR